MFALCVNSRCIYVTREKPKYISALCLQRQYLFHNSLKLSRLRWGVARSGAKQCLVARLLRTPLPHFRNRDPGSQVRRPATAMGTAVRWRRTNFRPRNFCSLHISNCKLRACGKKGDCPPSTLQEIRGLNSVGGGQSPFLPQ